MKTLIAGAAALFLSTSIASAQSISDASLIATALSDAKTGIALLNDGEYTDAANRLALAAKAANHLKVRGISSDILAAAPAASSAPLAFGPTPSSTLSFDDVFGAPAAGETSITDEKGRRVSVRVYSDAAALERFEIVASDTKMLLKENLEVIVMAGAPAIKRREEDGSFSVLMMSADDHALIEIAGESEEAVMALVETLEM